MADTTKFVIEADAKGAESVKKFMQTLEKAFKKEGIYKGIAQTAAALAYLAEITRDMPSSVDVQIKETKGSQKLLDFVEKYQLELRAVLDYHTKLKKKLEELEDDLSKKKKQKELLEKVVLDEKAKKEAPPEVFERHAKVLKEKETLETDVEGINELLSQSSKISDVSERMLDTYNNISTAIRKGWIRDIKDVDTLSTEYYNKTITKEQELARQRHAEHQLILRRAYETLRTEEYKSSTRAEKAKITRIGTQLDLLSEPGAENADKIIGKVKEMFQSLGVDYIELAGKSEEATKKLIKDLKAYETTAKDSLKRKELAPEERIPVEEPKQAITRYKEVEQTLAEQKRLYTELLSSPPLFEDQEEYNKHLDKGKELVENIVLNEEILRRGKKELQSYLDQEVKSIERAAKLTEEKQRFAVERHDAKIGPRIGDQEQFAETIRIKEVELAQITHDLDEAKKRTLKEVISDNTSLQSSLSEQNNIIATITSLTDKQLYVKKQIYELELALTAIGETEKIKIAEIEKMKKDALNDEKIKIAIAKEEYDIISDLATNKYPTSLQIQNEIANSNKRILQINKEIAELAEKTPFDAAPEIEKKLKERETEKVHFTHLLEAQKKQKEIEKERSDINKDKQFQEKTAHKLRLKFYEEESGKIEYIYQQMKDRLSDEEKHIYENLPNYNEKLQHLLSITEKSKDSFKKQNEELNNISQTVEKKANVSLNRFSLLIKEAARNFFSIEKLIQRISFVITAKLSYDIFDKFNRSIRKAIQNIISFENEFAKVLGILVKTERHFEGMLKKDTLNLMSKYGQSIDVSTRALYDILSAQIETPKSTYVLEQSMKAAVAGFTDVKTSADAITTILNSYSLAAEHAGDISDWLFSVIRYGKTTMEELSPVIGRLTATTGQMGISLEEVGATLAGMTQAGIKTDIAVTSFNQLLLNIAKPTKDAIDIMRKYNVELSISAIKKEGLAGIMSKLQELTEEEMVAIASSRRGFMALANAVSHTEKYYQNYLNMVNRAGAAQDAFEVQADTAQFAINQLGQEMYRLTTIFSDVVLNLLTPFIKGLSAITRTLVEYEKTFKATTIVLIAFFAAKLKIYSLIPMLIKGIYSLTVGMIGYAKSLLGASAAQTAVTATAGVLLAKILPIIIAFAGIAYAISVFTGELKERKAIEKYTSRVEALTSSLKSFEIQTKKKEMFREVINEYKALANVTEKTEEVTKQFEKTISILSKETKVSAEKFRDIASGLNIAEEHFKKTTDKIKELNLEINKTRTLLLRLETEETQRLIRKDFEKFPGRDDKILSFLKINKSMTDFLTSSRQDLKDEIEIIETFLIDELNLRIKLRTETNEEEKEILNTRLDTVIKINDSIMEEIINNEEKFDEEQKVVINKIVRSFIDLRTKFQEIEFPKIETDIFGALDLQVQMAKGKMESTIAAYQTGLVTIQEVVNSYDGYINALNTAAEATEHLENSTKFFDNRVAYLNAKMEKAKTIFNLQAESAEQLGKELDKLKGQFDIEYTGIVSLDKEDEMQERFINNIKSLIEKTRAEISDTEDIEIINIVWEQIEEGKVEVKNIEKLVAEIRNKLAQINEIDFEDQMEYHNILEELRKTEYEKYIQQRKLQVKAEEELGELKKRIGEEDLERLRELGELKPEINITFAINTDSIKNVPYKTLQKLLKDPDLTEETKFFIEAEIKRRNADWDRLQEDIELLKKTAEDLNKEINLTERYFAQMIWGGDNTIKKLGASFSHLGAVVGNIFGKDKMDFTEDTKLWGKAWKDTVIEATAAGVLSEAAFGDPFKELTTEEQIEKTKELADEFKKLSPEALASRLEELSEMGGEAVQVLTEEYKKNKEEIGDEEHLQAVISATAHAVGQLQNIWSMYYNARMNQISKERDESIKAVEQKAKREMRSALWLEKEKEKIEEDAKKKEKAMRKKQRTIDIASAVINTSIAVTNALANIKAPWNIPFAALIAALGVIQVKMIASQPLAKGGVVGVVKGPGTGTSDSVPIRASRGEFVTKEKAVKGNEKIFYAMNEELAKGKSFTQFAKEYLENNGKVTSFIPKSIAKTNYATGGIIRKTDTRQNDVDISLLRKDIQDLRIAIEKEPITINLKAKGLTDEELSRKTERGKSKRLARGIG